MRSIVRALRQIALLITLSIAGVHAGSTEILRLATTTSTENSGLLEYLLPAFSKQTGYETQVVAVGTGAALRMGREGDVDVLLVHAPNAEKAFIDAGYGERRVSVMYNDFIIVGPQALEADSIQGVLAEISATEHGFISRGDDSGTHKKELSLWRMAGLEAKGDWYHESGQGMAKVLQIADELDAYTLVDRGTWLALQDKLSLKLAYADDNVLFNPYSIVALNSERFTDLNHRGANALIEWLISVEAQKLIGDFKINGEQLFIPDAKPAL